MYKNILEQRKTNPKTEKSKITDFERTGRFRAGIMWQIRFFYNFWKIFFYAHAQLFGVKQKLDLYVLKIEIVEEIYFSQKTK